MKVEKRISLFFAGLLCSSGMIDMLFGASYIVLMNQCGVDAFGTSIVFGISSLALAIFDYPSGNLSDWYGRKRMSAWGFIIWGIGLIAFGLSRNVALFSMSTIILSMGIALISGSPQAWYIDELLKLDRVDYKNKVLPILSGALSVFSAAGALIASFTNLLNVTYAIFFGGICAIITGIITMYFFEDNYGEKLSNNWAKEIVLSTKAFFNDKHMNKVLAYYIISGIPLTIFLLVWQLHALNELNMSKQMIGIALVLFMLAQALSGFVSGKLVKKYSNFFLTVLGEIINVCAFILLFFCKTNVITYCAILLMLEFGLGLEKSNSGAWMHDIIPSEKRSTYMSAITALNSGINFIVVMILGFLMKNVGYNNMWFIASGIQVISLIYITKYIRKLGDCWKKKEMNV